MRSRARRTPLSLIPTRNPMRSRSRCSPTASPAATPIPSALDALRRGLVIAQDSGSRIQESYLAMGLARLEAEHGDPRAALEYFTVAIRNYDNSGSTTTIRAPLGGLAPLFDRLGRHEAAATIAGFAIGRP
jgi:hypothetical protein